MLKTIFLALCGLLLIAAAPAAKRADLEARQDVLDRRVDELAERYSNTTAQDQRDLAAQESMAASARGMIGLTWVQIGIGAISVAGLGATVLYARQTYLAAKADLDATRDAALPQLTFSDFRLSNGPNGQGLRYSFDNKGPTGTRNGRWSCAIALEDGRPLRSAQPLKPGEPTPAANISGGGSHFFTIMPGALASEATLASYKDGRVSLSVVIRLEYDDIFNRPQVWEYRELRSGENLSEYWANSHAEV